MVDVKPRVRFAVKRDLPCWECIGPSFDSTPSWNGVRRAQTREDAYADWKLMWDAYVMIYKVTGKAGSIPGPKAVNWLGLLLPVMSSHG